MTEESYSLWLLSNCHDLICLNQVKDPWSTFPLETYAPTQIDKTLKQEFRQAKSQPLQFKN